MYVKKDDLPRYIRGNGYFLTVERFCVINSIEGHRHDQGILSVMCYAYCKVNDKEYKFAYNHHARVLRDNPLMNRYHYDDISLIIDSQSYYSVITCVEDDMDFGVIEDKIYRAAGIESPALNIKKL